MTCSPELKGAECIESAVASLVVPILGTQRTKGRVSSPNNSGFDERVQVQSNERVRFALADRSGPDLAVRTGRSAPLMRDNSSVRASVLHTFGPPSVLSLEDVAEPAVQPGQVKIEVAVANITFVDTQIRGGRAPNPAMLPTLPAILGNGVGGTVVEVGAGVETALLGTRAMASLNGRGGSAASGVYEHGGLVGRAGP